MHPEPTANPAESGSVTRLPVKPTSSTTNKRVRETDFDKEVWTAVEADYRTGTSYGLLEERFSIPATLIVARKQREGWRRDLSREVRAEVDAALAAGAASSLGSRDLSDSVLVERAANLGVAVVQRHRVVLSDAIHAVSGLAMDLRKAVEQVNKQGSPVLTFLGPKETLSEAALKLGNALARLVPLERKAFGLEDGGDDRPYEDQLRAFHAARAANSAKPGGDRA